MMTTMCHTNPHLRYFTSNNSTLEPAQNRYVSRQQTKNNEQQTGDVGEGQLAFESEILLVEYVDGLAGDDERPAAWTIASPVILGHHARVLHTQTQISTDTHQQRETGQTDRQTDLSQDTQLPLWTLKQIFISYAHLFWYFQLIFFLVPCDD